MLLRLIDNKENIERILNGDYPFSYLFYVKLIQIKKNILSFLRGKFNGYNNIEGIKEYNIEKDSFNFQKRKEGLSAFGRLYNAEDFLEQAVESHIKFFDEIVLVNNNSTDNTEQICLKLQKKYPTIIKYYNYPFDIYKIGSNEYENVDERSIYSLSYYYNWALSKTTYKYVIKLDDDHICIDNRLKHITEKIRKEGLNCFLQTPLINVYNINGTFSYSYNSLKSSFAGLFGDFGFFPVTEKSYFIKLKGGESLIFPYKIKTEKISFLHLKWLKKGMGLGNYGFKVQNNLLKRIKHNNFEKLNEKYIKILKDYGI